MAFDKSQHASDDEPERGVLASGSLAFRERGSQPCASLRERRLSSGKSNVGRNAPQAQPTPAWLWLLLIGGFGLIFWQFVPRRDRPKPPPAPVSWVTVTVFPAATIIVIGSLVAWLYFRIFDRGVRRAEKRAQEGDLDGAIADLREQIEEKGPSQDRVNALGIFLMRKERWDEAAMMFRKAEQIGTHFKGVCQANLGLALLRGGKPADAIPALEEAASIGPHTPPLTCIVSMHMSLALADLGRWDEAEEHFRRAEEAARGLRKSQLAALKGDLDKCRQKLEQHSREQPKPEGLAEL